MSQNNSSTVYVRKWAESVNSTSKSNCSDHRYSDNRCSNHGCDTCIDRDFHNDSAYLRSLLGKLNQNHQCPKLPKMNCEENRYRCYNYNGSFTKSLEHNTTDGRLVSYTQYDKMVKALHENDQICLNNVKLDPNAQVKLNDPLASLATSLEGKPACLLHIDTPPNLSSESGAADMVEVYSMAVCRDVPFINFATDSTIATMLDSNHMNNPNIISNLRYYTPTNTNFTTQTIFRGISADEKYGPYISQLLYLNVPMGAINYAQQYTTPDSRTVAQGVPTRVEWGVNEAETINIQNTFLTAIPPATASANISPKYLFSGRGLGEAVHSDAAFQYYYQASEILFALGALPNPGWPVYANQVGFVTGPANANLWCTLGEVTKLALLHAWYWKWQVFRRLRPEEFGLAVNNVQNSLVSNANNYDLSSVVLTNGILGDVATVNSSWGFSSSYTLPLAFREGCPVHPSYPAAHAVCAGANCTILKMFFDCEHPWSSLAGLQIGTQNRKVLPSPLVGPVIEANTNGTALQDYTGGDASNLTIGGEINKLGSNVAIGRTWAGVHYRSDDMQGIELGEQVAIAYMEDILASTVENNVSESGSENCLTPPKITFKKFDDTYYTVMPKTCYKC
ncbi:MAG: hypothetical protein Homavirus12_10 [Homavirus sp.]|uniref:Phosphatidic acid phosphatase type 2/haloperoxidase domain-containing protein n=1 Tax=Homavirus sp. TaxID=2487769 RepID=A0A3G5A4J4_9VIRU|nr:MAG: hypothetical protein Homavirus12_10 [Homavirus sp.]